MLGAVGHDWGWSTCHWLRSCNPTTEKVGSPCNVTHATVAYSGYCFESSSGTLECGHTTALDDQYGEKPIAVVTTQSPNVMPSQRPFGQGPVASSATAQVLHSATFRCEQGAAATYAGAYVGKRLLIAGCLITADAAYSPTADVHVPEYCNTPANFNPGCMVPGATNFDPMAKQPTQCRYATRGCRSSTAINYNSDATVDDPNQPCVEAVYGCTVAPISYTGVASTTPGFKSGFYGKAVPNVGQISETEYGGTVVLNYAPTANVLQGCVVAIEGCMDSSAVNYDRAANVQTGSWCIPPVSGCMMPTAEAAGLAFNPPAGKTRDGLSMIYSPSATVHDASMCGGLVRIGCMRPNITVDGVVRRSLNYDPHANIEADCYPELEGCLNPTASNFGCTSQMSAPCPSSQVQNHSRAICVFPMPPMAPQAPPPPLPPGSVFVSMPAVTISFVAAGSPEDYTDAIRLRILTVFTDAAGVSEERGSITVIPASVLIDVTIEMESMAAADAAAASISQTLGTTAASASAVLGIEVQSVPVIEAKTILVERRISDLAPAVPPGILAAICFSVIIVFFLGFTLFARYRFPSSTVQILPEETKVPANNTSKSGWPDDDDDEEDSNRSNRR